MELWGRGISTVTVFWGCEVECGASPLLLPNSNHPTFIAVLVQGGPECSTCL